MFVIDPFQMDSLDEFANESIDLDGEFISGGIFMKHNCKNYNQTH